MSKRNESRPGYKKTKVGWIPEEWECVPIRDVAKVVTGSTPSTKNPEYYGSEFLFVGPADLDNGKYVVDSVKKLSRDGFNVCRKIPVGSTLFTCIGSTIGKVAIAGKELATNQQINAVIARKEETKEYLYYALSRLSPIIKALATEQAVPIVNKSEFSAYKIPLPPFPEQKKIAEILSTWERAIDLLGKLIDAKQRLKKGLMQQLLTGRMRFTEFGKPTLKKGELPEGWREVQLKNIAEISFSGVDKKSRSGQKRVRLCNYTDVYNNNYITADMDFMNTTATDTEIEKYSLNVGDIMITKDSETPDDIGVPSIVTEKLDNVICGYHLALIKPNLEKANPIFLAKQIGYEQIANQFSRLANGATRFGLTTSSVKSVRLWLPKLEEQRCIAVVLSACDREIELLKKKQEKLKEQKKGLMQKLLTGEVRVTTITDNKETGV